MVLLFELKDFHKLQNFTDIIVEQPQRNKKLKLNYNWISHTEPLMEKEGSCWKYTGPSHLFQ